MIGLTGLILAWRQDKFDALRYGTVMFLLPLTYYFAHPEPYHMRAVDPLLVILGSFAIVKFRDLRAERAERAAASIAILAGVEPLAEGAE
jgi:hypothetical protein